MVIPPTKHSIQRTEQRHVADQVLGHQDVGARQQPRAQGYPTQAPIGSLRNHPGCPKRQARLPNNRVSYQQRKKTFRFFQTENDTSLTRSLLKTTMLSRNLFL